MTAGVSLQSVISRWGSLLLTALLQSPNPDPEPEVAGIENLIILVI